MELKKITSADLEGKGVVGMADTPNLSALEMQNKVEEIVRSVVIPVINHNIDYTVSKKELNETIFNSGSGDMMTEFYDSNLDGIVNSADNGNFVYTHTAGSLAGSGRFGVFRATQSETLSAVSINGGIYSVRCGGEREIELTAGSWYSFILDGDTVNFKQGGAGLNFSVVGGTVQPASPKENTVWINTSAAVNGYVFSPTEPENPAEGMVWITTASGGELGFSATKKNSVMIYPFAVQQYLAGEWVPGEGMIYQDGTWKYLGVTVYDKGDQCTAVTGGWQSIDGANSKVTFEAGGIKFNVTSSSAGRVSSVYTVDKIDVTSAKQLRLDVATLTPKETNGALSVGVIDTPYTANDSGAKFVAACAAALRIPDTVTATTSYYVDISRLSGEYHVEIVAGIANALVVKCRLE